MPADQLKIENYVPFGDTITGRLRIVQDHGLDALIQQSQPYDRAYLAWETVRKRRNPYFENGTGFEGYLVGLCRSPDEALARVLQINRGILTSIMRLHRSEPRFRSRLFKVLLDESNDTPAITEWLTQLGAALARLRCHVLCSRQAADFHTETYRIVAGLPPIAYREMDDSVKQVYILNGHHADPVPKLRIDSQALSPDDQEAWLVAESIGKFGHPLVRVFFNRGPG